MEASQVNTLKTKCIKSTTVTSYLNARVGCILPVTVTTFGLMLVERLTLSLISHPSPVDPGTRNALTLGSKEAQCSAIRSLSNEPSDV